MLNLNLNNSQIAIALKWGKFPLFRYAKIIRTLLFILFIFSFCLFLYGFFPGNFVLEKNRMALGYSILALDLALCFWIKEAFLSALKQARAPVSLQEVIIAPGKYNLADFFSFELAQAMQQVLKAGKVNSGALSYFILAGNPKLNFIFNRALLDIKSVKTEFLGVLNNFDPQDESSFQDIIIEALKTAQRRNHLKIEIGDAISSLVRSDKTWGGILVNNQLKPEDFDNLILWLEILEKNIARSKRFWDYESLAKRGTLAKEWTAGFSITLDRYSRDLTPLVKGSTPEYFSHKEETLIAERILSRLERNNVLIIGEPGSGRKSVIYGLAQKSLLGKSLAEVNYKRVVEIDMPALLAQMPDSEELESTLDAMFREAISAGNIILVIDEFHNYIGQQTRPGIIDITGVISPYLALPQFQFIAITNYEGFHRNIEPNSSLISLFEKIEVQPVSQENTLLILESLVPLLEAKYKIFLPFAALRDIVVLTDRYLPALSFPEKAIQFLEEAAVYVAAKKRKIVLPKDVAKLLTEKTEIPVGEMGEKEKGILLNLENLIHQRIINQEEAVKEVATALRRARSEVTIRKGPIGCFLFLGPTGVGKTETSKALAQFYFGAEEKMVRLDMSEFQSTQDIARLIGSKDEPGLLVSKIRENPFSLLLLDEIEKAHPNVLNLFLQVLDEGFLTDGWGRRVDFKNTIIIATSNAGYKIILQALKEKSAWQGVKQRILDYLFNEGTFRPEFINRFDATVVFRPLNKENLLDVAELMLQNLKKNLQDKGIEFIITLPLKEKIVDLGYSPVFGAREMRRVLQDKVENVLATALLSGKIKKGCRVEINQNFELIIN